MRVQFVEKSNGPERLVCDAEILFDEGQLAGMKMVGFSVWRGAEGDVYVTFPSRAFGTASDRKYFDYLRAIEPGVAPSRKVKDWILEELRYQRNGEPRPELHQEQTVEVLEELFGGESKPRPMVPGTGLDTSSIVGFGQDAAEMQSAEMQSPVPTVVAQVEEARAKEAEFLQRFAPKTIVQVDDNGGF